jgi:hypothetical protein
MSDRDAVAASATSPSNMSLCIALTASLGARWITMGGRRYNVARCAPHAVLEPDRQLGAANTRSTGLGHSSWQVRPRRSTWCRWAPCRRPPRPSATTQHLIRSRGALRSKRVVIGPGYRVEAHRGDHTELAPPLPRSRAEKLRLAQCDAVGGRQGRGRRSRDRSTSGTAPHRRWRRGSSTIRTAPCVGRPPASPPTPPGARGR